ncbi:hypothetical protein HDU83_003710 [Entophlyctis luteolus]|nr:hypothetical protein HDU83_003710 [Entophlyctis luteolus]KAJ3379566.1 hypothetical protein HDU84_006543 [Entophlyctis sp. JEL0112]
MESLITRPTPAASSRQSSRPMTPRTPVPKRPSPLSREYDYETFGPPSPTKRLPFLSKRIIAIAVGIVAALIVAVVIGVVLRNASTSSVTATADANVAATTASNSSITSQIPKLTSETTFTILSTSSDEVSTTATDAPPSSAAEAVVDVVPTSAQISTVADLVSTTNVALQPSAADTVTTVVVTAAAVTTAEPSIQSTTSSLLLTSTGVRATWWASTSDVGGCQLPTATYSSGFTGAIALGDISTLGQLSYTAGYCGQVFQIDCGNGAVNAVVASTCNLGQGNCGIDMITSTWNAATANAAFGSTSCSVSLTSANPLPGTDAVCYYRPTSDFANAYYKLLGVLNTSGRLVASAALDGIAGSVSSGDWYQFQAGASPFSDASVLVFTYTDGSSSTFALSACAQPSGVQVFS